MTSKPVTVAEVVEKMIIDPEVNDPDPKIGTMEYLQKNGLNVHIRNMKPIKTVKFSKIVKFVRRSSIA